MISVVIPTYNRAHFLAETLESVFAQVFREFEVVVVDDGSTDNTRQVLEDFSRRTNVRYVFQQNAGRSIARNRGLELARGRYIMFLDSDDLLRPEALATLFETAASSPKSGIIGGKRKFVDEDLEMIDCLIAMRPEAAIESEWLNLRAIRDIFLPPSTYIVKKQLAAAIRGFDTAMEPAEDFDFFVKSCERSPVSYVNSVVVHMRRHDGNTDEVELRQAAVRVAKANLSKLAKTDEQAAALWNTRIADDLYAMGRELEALAHYLTALRLRSGLDRRVRRWIVLQMSKCVIPARLKDAIRR